MYKPLRYVTLFCLITVMLSLVGCSSGDENTIKVGMELKWPPFETTDNDGNPEGISVMLAEELGNYLGKEIEIVDLPFASLIPALESGNVVLDNIDIHIKNIETVVLLGKSGSGSLHCYGL